MPPVTTLKRQAGADVNFSDGMYVVLSENSSNLQGLNLIWEIFGLCII